ncbi:hypothetical protein HZB96_02520 [Candidatus Gottesmanbacteria bacterium]|nr:hypothetical protein [Candidatus Gottesmanbacteria bacterium]MBI5451998.1 hypothetical protein [Candidatus Gottesmanbacteria bacterium]
MINVGLTAVDKPDEYPKAKAAFDTDVNTTAARLGIPFDDFNEEMHDLFVDTDDSGLNEEEPPL